jgi:hypothetical protein
MTPRVRYGLIAGGVGLVINICVGALIGLCGPFIGLIAGAAAGFFAAQAEKAPTQAEGARLGAIAGAIAGTLVLVGQLSGGVASLAYIQSAGVTPLFGELPDVTDTAGQVGYWVAGVGVGFCFGLVGIVFGALTGAGAGYLGTPTPTITSQDPSL